MTAVLVKKMDVQLKDGEWYPVLAMVGPMPLGGEPPKGGGTQPASYLIDKAEGEPRLRWIHADQITDVNFELL